MTPAADGIGRWTRLALGIGLVVLLVLGVPRGPEPGEPVLVGATTTADELAAILVRDGAAMLTYSASAPPTRAVATLMASAAAGGAEVTLAVPGDAGRVRVVPPDRAVARRRAALEIGVGGEAGTDVPVTITGQSGTADTVSVRITPDGRGEVSVAVEPSRAGAATWTVRTPDAEAVAHAWVRPEAPVRVLVWSGVPGWESRWLIRGLEAAGMEVAVRQDLGRGLAVTTEGASAPRSVEDLAAYDVLALVGAAADSIDEPARRWVAERGGGLLLVGAAASAPALAAWAPRGAAADVAAADLAWRGPAEIVPLPAAEIVTRAVRVGSGGLVVAATTEAGSSATDTALARASYLGRGRIFASGLETWPWAMEAGLGAEHQAYWESVVEWLAGGLTDDIALLAGPAQPWVRWDGRLEGEAPSALTLRRPSTAPGESTPDEVLPARTAATTPATIAFVPVTEGGHALEIGTPYANREMPDAGTGSSTVGAFGIVAAPPTERLTWTAAALEVGRAGGRIVSESGDETGVEPGVERGAEPGVERDADAAADASARARPARPPRALPWILFLLLATLAVAGWTARRIGGRP